MIIKRKLIVLLLLGILLVLLGSIMPFASAAEYENVKSNFPVYNNSTMPQVTTDSCYMTFTMINATNNSCVHVVFNGPGYPYEEHNIPVGQTDYYFNGFIRIYVIYAANDTAWVDVSKLTSSGGTSEQQSGTQVSCDIPGLTARGGDVVTFPLIIRNMDASAHTYDLSSSSDVGWSTWFEYGGNGIFKISVPAGQSKSISFKVQTLGKTPVGTYKVTANVQDIKTELSVDVTSVNQSAQVYYKVGSKIAIIGDTIMYDMNIKNVQPSENVYGLSVEGLPENWYARFKEGAMNTQEVGEVVMPGSATKDLVIEIVPPYSVTAGVYNFTVVVTTPDEIDIKKNLVLTLKSTTEMSVMSSRLAYDAKPAEPFDIVIYVSNTGSGSALTNVYVEPSAPQGWVLSVSPNRTNSIKSGEAEAFTLSVTPPGNIVVSDYLVTAKVKSDQAEKDQDYRISIKIDSYVQYIAAVMIVLVVVCLFFVYRKYGRR